MKRTPQLDFCYDDTLDKALHIEKVMQREEAVLGERGARRSWVRRRRYRRSGGRAVMKALPADLAAVCRRMRGEREVAITVHDRPLTPMRWALPPACSICSRSSA